VKRVEAVIEVFSRIAAAVPARLLLVGDGPDLSKAIDRAQQLGVGERVEALGEQDQVVPLLSISDLFLLPSRQESFGLAALEAMACRVPVVASAVGGLSEVIEHGHTGFLHDVDDLVGMSASGILVLSDPGLHAAIAASGRRTVKERFCADLIVPRYETFYEELLR
jgi:N-acetyl-alpha-D-glucosaminyl L-malate synthase BshA